MPSPFFYHVDHTTAYIYTPYMSTTVRGIRKQDVDVCVAATIIAVFCFGRLSLGCLDRSTCFCTRAGEIIFLANEGSGLFHWPRL